MHFEWIPVTKDTSKFPKRYYLVFLGAHMPRIGYKDRIFTHVLLFQLCTPS